MAGIVANYVVAYGFVISISNERYFVNAMSNRNMCLVKIKKRWLPFINEVGWTRYSTIEEQSGLFVFGERIRSTEDGNLVYLGDGNRKARFYDVRKDILKRKIRNKALIDKEARFNGMQASVLLFLND